MDAQTAYRLRKQAQFVQDLKQDKWIRMARFDKALGGEFAMDGVLILDPEHNFFWGRNSGRRLWDKLATYSGGANGNVQDKSGLWTPQTAANRLRYSNNGMYVEPASTNSIRNTSNTGAVVGQLGFGGAVPTDWNMGGFVSCNRRVVAFGTANGLPFIDLRMDGTQGSTGGIAAWDFCSPAGVTNVIAGAQGQVWSASFFAQMVAGSVTNIGSATLSVNQVQADGSTSNGLQSTTNILPTLSDGLPHQFTLPGITIAGATTAFLGPRARWVGGTTGTAMDITVRFWGIQLEQTSVVTSPIVTVNAAVARSADVLTLGRSGITKAHYIFDDGSTQTVTGISAGSNLVIPTNLNRRIIKAARFYKH